MCSVSKAEAEPEPRGKQQGSRHWGSRCKEIRDGGRRGWGTGGGGRRRAGARGDTVGERAEVRLPALLPWFSLLQW